MEITLLISENFIKQSSFIDENVDVALIRTAIVAAQDMHMIDVIGSGLMSELKTQISAGTTTALNITLLDTYISQAMLWWTLYEGADILTFKFRNKSVMKMSSDNGQPVSLEEVKRLMDGFRNKAESYSERVTKYLIQNQSSYPLFTNPGTGADVIFPKMNNFSSGWYLGRSRKRDTDWNPYENLSDCE